MKRKILFYIMRCVAIMLISSQSMAMEAGTAEKFIFTDLIETDVKSDIKYKLFWDEIGAVVKDRSGYRLPTKLEAQEICQCLDKKHLCGIYERDDFELTYQDFWISDGSSEQAQIYCPLQKHDNIKTPEKGEKCCLRLVQELKIEPPPPPNRIAAMGSYALECISPYCTLKNAVLGVAALGVGGAAGIYYYKYLCAAAKVGSVVVVADNVLDLRRRLAEFYQVCRDGTNVFVVICRIK